MDSVRPKVSFQPGPAASIEQVDNVIEYLKRCSSENAFYKIEQVIRAIKSSETADHTLGSWLKQFKDNIFFLDKENERITGAVLDIDWTSRSEEITTVYHELILNLVSAHTYYLLPVLLMINKVFTKVTSDDDSVSEEEEKFYQLGHRLLKDIVALVPLAPSTLCRVLDEKFPYLKRPAHLIMCYVENTLTVTTYLPSHRQVILEDLFDKCLQIDVHCPRETIELWELDKDENDQDFAMEVDSKDDSMAYPLANALDYSMQSLFRYVDRCCFQNKESKELNWDSTKKLFKALLTVFDKLILPTHRCNHVQFVLFYMCSLRPALCEGFLDYLWKKVKHPYTAPVLRQILTFYIGSLLSRALFVSVSTVCACMDLMCSWVHSYINNHDSKKSADVGAHGTFHCVCQTIFYVFAFRHKELINMANGFKYLRGLNFERIVTCRLNPLKYCHPIVIQNFASIARNYQIAYCYPVIERNNRSLMFNAANSDNLAAMNTFFPFDPYQLKRSKKWIEPLYRKYEGNIEEDSQNNDDEGSLIEESDVQSSHNPLFSYSSSPGFKQNLHSISSKVR